MSMNNRKIAGFMTAESIYSLAFYIIMVAAVAGIGASVLAKKDSAKAVSAISLLRANIVADTATLGAPAGTAMDADYVAKMSGNLLASDGTDATLPDGATVEIITRSVAPSYSINVAGLNSPELCNAIAGVGWGTWNGYHIAVAAAGNIASNASIPSTVSTQSAARGVCDGAGPAATAVIGITFGFNL